MFQEIDYHFQFFPSLTLFYSYFFSFLSFFSDFHFIGHIIQSTAIPIYHSSFIDRQIVFRCQFTDLGFT